MHKKLSFMQKKTHQPLPDVLPTGVEGDDELFDRRLDPKNFRVLLEHVEWSVDLYVRRLLVERILKIFSF